MSLLYLLIILIFLKAGAYLVIHVVHYGFDRTPIGFCIEHMKIYTKVHQAISDIAWLWALCCCRNRDLYYIYRLVYAVTPIPAV